MPPNLESIQSSAATERVMFREQSLVGNCHSLKSYSSRQDRMCRSLPVRNVCSNRSPNSVSLKQSLFVEVLPSDFDLI
jgi:hypothetical protein